MSDAALLLAANACFLVAGVGVLRLAGWPTRVGLLGLAYLAGVAAYGIAAQALFVLGAPLTRWQVVAVCASLGLLGLVPRRRSVHVGPPLARFELVLGGAVAAMLLLLALDLWFQPLWAYDSWTFWTPKGVALARLDGLDAGWFTQPALLNKDYPLLLPAVEAAGFRFTGVETRLLDLQSWLFLAGFASAFPALVRPRAARLVTWTVLVMVVFAPSIAAQLAYAEADVPLAVFFASAGLFAWLWLEEREPRDALLLALFGAASVATKAEGLIFVVALFAALTVLARPFRFRLASLGLGAAVLACGLLPWRIWMHANGIENQSALGRTLDLSFLAGHPGRLPHAAAYVAVKLLDPTAWLLLLPLAALALVCALRSGERRGPVFAALTFTLAVAGLVLAYWTTPLDFDYHLATSARRVISGPVLFLAVMIPFLAREPSDS